MPWLTGDTPEPNKWYCRLTRIPYSLGFLQAVGGALGELTLPHNWEQFGTMTPEESAEAATEMFYEWTRSDICMIGIVTPYVTTTPPPNCLPCNGSIYNRVDYPTLYEKLAAAYIIDADTFRTPDMRSKFVIGASVDYPMASTGGEAEHTMTEDELVAHTHTTEPHAHTTQPHGHATAPHNHTDAGHVHGEIPAIPSIAGIGIDAPVPSAVPGAGVTAPASANLLPADVTVIDNTVVVDDTIVTVNETGGGAPFSILPPYEAMSYCIVAK